jgi:hypothetical protein
MLKLYAKMKLLLALAAFPLLFLMAGCNQDSIFDDISWETAPTQPKIKGSPSKMALVKAADPADPEAPKDKDRLYIANGRLWVYEYDSTESAAASWKRAGWRGGFVADVASTTDGNESFLYVLDLDSSTVSKGTWNATEEKIDWTPITPPGGYRFIQNIFGAGDTLFAAGANSTGDDNKYAILYCKQSDSNFSLLPSGETGASFLTGAGKVGTNYYLATLGSGLYKAPSDISKIDPVKLANHLDENGATVVDENGKPELLPVPANIAGLLQTQNALKQDIIIGVSRQGTTVHINSSDVPTVNSFSLGITYTGALALMDNPNPQNSFDKLLLLGYSGSNSSYQHGYREVLFNSDNGNHNGSSRTPGANESSSIESEQQYSSSLRRYPVTALWVLPNLSPSVIFAATTNQGLYSYRYRSAGGWQWNYEE